LYKDKRANIPDFVIIIQTTPNCKAEKYYAATVLLQELLGLPFRFEWSARAQQHYILSLPNGATVAIEDHFFGALQGPQGYNKSNLPQSPNAMNNPFSEGKIDILYGNKDFLVEDKAIYIGNDLFANTFFMLTRWEEYAQPEQFDLYGRFPAKASLAYQRGFLQRPVVHEWAALLRACFERLGLTIDRPVRHKSRLVYSHDVDHPVLWTTRWGRWRSAGNSIKHGGLVKGLRYWWSKEYWWAKTDPFNTFARLMEQADQAGTKSTFNFLGRRPPHFDCWYDLESPFVQQLMQDINQCGHRIGFHPSREAAADPVRFEEELASLRAVSPQPVEVGRHHYLCFSAPHTWQRWADAGLREDSTLGYHDMSGFRAGMCTDFPVFNFLTRQMLPLREQPLIAMDVTFPVYQKATPEQMYQTLCTLAEQTDRHDGQFTLLWHNSSFNTYFWTGYEAALEQFIRRFGVDY
jgi:hypothetical protein